MAFITELTLGFVGITAETRVAVDLAAMRAKNSRIIDAEVEVSGANVAVKYGYNSATQADYTFDGTTRLLPAGNYHCVKGTVKQQSIPTVTSYVSVCPKAGGTADVFINFGFERT